MRRRLQAAANPDLRALEDVKVEMPGWLALLGVLLGIAAALAPFLPVLFQGLGPRLFYRLPRRQMALAGAGVALGVAAVIADPSAVHGGALAATLFLAGHAFLYPHRLLVALDDPPHTAGNDIGPGAPVLGTVVEGAACAWLLEMLVPRHLINDQVQALPVLVAY